MDTGDKISSYVLTGTIGVVGGIMLSVYSGNLIPQNLKMEN